MHLDGYDLSILAALQEDSRTSLTELGRLVGLSRFAVRDRIGKLFVDRVIVGPTIVVNPALVGLRRTVFLELKTNPHEPWVAELLERMRACDVLDGITGEYSLLGRFRLGGEHEFRHMLRGIDEAMSRSFFKKYRVIDVINTFKESGVPFSKRTRTTSLDDMDRGILEVLLNQTEYAKSPRPLTTTGISRVLRSLGVQISQPAVFKRLMRLESHGVILKHTIIVDHLKLGVKTKLVIRIKVSPASYDTVARGFLAPMNEITDLYRTGEDYGLLAIARASDISECNSFLLGLYSSKDVIDTYTILVLQERKRTSLPLGGDHKNTSI